MIIEAYGRRCAGGSRRLKSTGGLRAGSLPLVTLYHEKLDQLSH
jgi:hypothetical protein